MWPCYNITPHVGAILNESKFDTKTCGKLFSTEFVERELKITVKRINI